MRTTHHGRHRFAQNADHFAHDTPLLAFFAEVVCTLGASPPRTATLPPANGGGNCTIRGATRRRHAEGRPLMAQNPHQRCGTTRRSRRASEEPEGVGGAGGAGEHGRVLKTRARPRRPRAVGVAQANFACNSPRATITESPKSAEYQRLDFNI